MPRKKFIWQHPRTGKRYKLEIIPDFVRILTTRVETDEDAESFFAAYAECCTSEKHAEHSIGYIANLIKDKDIRDDVLDLFLVDAQVPPVQLFKPEYRFGYRGDKVKVAID